MDDASSIFVSYASEYGIDISDEQKNKFRIYAQFLTEWNEKINLTAVTSPDGIAVKHFLDSVLLLKYCDIPYGENVIDVGTGAGFPGVPIKIMRPDINLVLLDSLNKRLVFLSELLKAVGISAELVHARAEEAGRQEGYRMKFGFATARAVASMPVLCEYCLPFLKKGGIFAAMKGPNVEPELKEAEKAVSLLGCKIEKDCFYTLPSGEKRSVVLIRRTESLSDKYPRHGSKIAHSPLISH
jgi:16S rRNA (guanine527-N7)-methyltransferase